MSLQPNERETLAKEIWRAGTSDPDLLAEWLIKQGYGKKDFYYKSGLVSGMSKSNEYATRVEPEIIRQSNFNANLRSRRII